jgi:hypothetical protein
MQYYIKLIKCATNPEFGLRNPTLEKEKETNGEDEPGEFGGCNFGADTHENVHARMRIRSRSRGGYLVSA